MAPQFQRAIAGVDPNLGSTIVPIPRGESSLIGGHEPGCKQVPTYRTHRKPGATDGEKGSSGRTPTNLLTPGRNGSSGSGAILVRHDDGSVSSYQSHFEFQLIDFEVVDENDDGIFEPGECAIIKNITVKNTGKVTLEESKIPFTNL
jgi:hypothetical protein